MRNKLYVSFSVFLCVLLLASCGGDVDEKFISEGVIEFDAKVIDNTHPMATMAPSKMVFKFKDNKSSVEMSAGMGLFSASFVSDPTKKTLTQLIKLLNKKFAVIQTMEDINTENEEYPLELIPTKETKVIAGYTCAKMHVKVKNESKEEFDVFYTKELNIQNPNFATPYNQIDGVLMEYQMKKFGLEMRFTAKSVAKKEIDDETFKLNKDYKISTKEEIDLIFLGIQ